MNPWREVLDRIEAGEDEELARFLDGLNDLGRRAVAVQLPAHLAEELRGGVEARWEIEGLAPGYRLAGAACFTGARQVAAWLNRRELRRPVNAERDARRIMSVLRGRGVEWRRELALRLADGLRPQTGRSRRDDDGMPGWDLTAALVADTGIEPPDGDAFVAGWVWRLVLRRRWNRGGLDGDPLLVSMVPRLFTAQGVAGPLALDERWNSGLSILAELAVLADEGKVARAALVGGCAGRFLADGPAEEIAPFVRLWRLLAPEPDELPVVDFVRLLPRASPPLAQLALEELGRAEDAGLLDDDLFAEAVGALAYRQEKKFVLAAVRWLARAPAPRGGCAVRALAPVFEVNTPALRERAVRLALTLAPHADDNAGEAIRAAAALLPPALREQVSAAYGTSPGAEPEPRLASEPRTSESPPVAAVPRESELPALAPPIDAPGEVVVALRELARPEEPHACERVLAGLVELAHRDRDALAAALRPAWWRHLPVVSGSGPDVFDHFLTHHRGVHTLLTRCALALVDPERSRKVSAAAAEPGGYHADHAWPPQILLRRRLEEVIALFERGRSVPALLATPTEPTGHVAAATLVERMEALGNGEPLPADFEQALLRLPRHTGPESLTRAERLPTEAGRTLATWLRAGGWPDPAVTWQLHEDHTWTGRLRPTITPPARLPGWLAELWLLKPGHVYLSYPPDAAWWPMIMPSHREIVATALVRCMPLLSEANDVRMDALATLAHGEGPVGQATALAIAAGLGHRRDTGRAAALGAARTLAARGQLPARDLGWALAKLLRHRLVPLKRITGSLGELTETGAHTEVWHTLAVALPPLLPGPGERPRAGLGELLGVGVRAAALAGTRAEITGLAEMAARKGSSLVLYEARRLHETISA
ncbi:DUF6493 family protein [Nonomuraea sp. NPDC059023]|uniref:DUF7825 domain-containing protein n=1 Tax=unclassified Nonomuraea TaxID=2593643 RepID=UPI0036ACFD63